MHAPAPLDTVRAFESKHGVSIPTGYRDFLVRVSNGGPGPPDYGLNRLGEPASDMLPDEKRQWTQLTKIREPFPFTKHWIWENGETFNEGTRDDVGCGSILIGNDGCGGYWHLVVMGADRGIPWMLAGEGIQPVCPKRPFLDWYEDWLDGRDSFYGFNADSG